MHSKFFKINYKEAKHNTSKIWNKCIRKMWSKTMWRPFWYCQAPNQGPCVDIFEPERSTLVPLGGMCSGEEVSLSKFPQAFSSEPWLTDQEESCLFSGLIECVKHWNEANLLQREPSVGQSRREWWETWINSYSGQDICVCFSKYILTHLEQLQGN